MSVFVAQVDVARYQKPDRQGGQLFPLAIVLSELPSLTVGLLTLGLLQNQKGLSFPKPFLQKSANL